MRLAIAQLRKLKMPYSFTEELDLSDELNGFEDIISSSMAKVKGVIDEVSHDRYLVSMDIFVTLKVTSAISLREIDLPISTSVEEIYSKQKEEYEDEDINIIEKDTLDTKDAIVTQILCEKPMRSVGDDEEYISDDDSFPDEDLNPAFSSLKDLLK